MAIELCSTSFFDNQDECEGIENRYTLLEFIEFLDRCGLEIRVKEVEEVKNDLL